VDITKTGVWSWLMQRITAVYIFIGVVVHFMVVHYYISVKTELIDTLVTRITSIGWQIFDFTLLAAVTYDALNGIYTVICDLGISRKARRVWTFIFWILGIAITVLGFLILTRLVAVSSPVSINPVPSP